MKIFLLILIVGCGAQNQDNNSGLSLAETTTAQTQAQSNYTLYLDSKADMPACSAANKGQLIYIKEDSSFYACNDAWGAVTIQGPTTTVTVVATSQDSGSPLATAQVTTVTVTTTNTVIERPVLTSDSKVIIDRTDGNMWFLGTSVSALNMDETTLCPKGSSLPSQGQADAAFQSGLIKSYAILEGVDSFWIGAGEYIQYGGYLANGYIFQVDSSLTSAQMGEMQKRPLCLIPQ